jgi:hypothetical protein
MVTMYTPSRSVFVQCEGVTALWKLLKVRGALGAGGGEERSVYSEDNTSAGGVSSVGESPEDEEATLVMIGHIAKELTDELQVTDVNYERKMLADGIMSIVLKLAKYELPLLKLDMSFAIYNLSRGVELIKLLKAETVDILFWLTLHDTLGTQDLICKNVSRALRCFCFSAEECKLLVKQERFMPVFKCLIKSKNEDVLWQTAGVMYNLMGIEHCLKVLLDRNLVSLIFEIANSGYPSVKHVCSACLHMIPEHMPNMEDPVVLELVLCLLEAQGDKFSELGNKPDDNMPYNMVHPCYAGTLLKHTGTDFKALWTHQSCEVDNVFSPTLMFTPTDHSLDSVVPNLDAGSLTYLAPHSKMRAGDYQDFRKEFDGKPGQPGWGMSNDQNDALESALSAPMPSAKAPPGFEDPSFFSSAALEEDSESLAMQERRRANQKQDEDLTKLHNVLTGHRMKDGLGSAGASVASLFGSRSVHSTGAGNSTSPRSRTHLPLINNPPRMPENTVGALVSTIRNDARQQQQALRGEGSHHTVPHLSMSGSLDSLSLTKMDALSHHGGGGQPGSRGGTAAADVSASKSFTKGGHSRVVQVSVNSHGNFSR